MYSSRHSGQEEPSWSFAGVSSPAADREESRVDGEARRASTPFKDRQQSSFTSAHEFQSTPPPGAFPSPTEQSAGQSSSRPDAQRHDPNRTYRPRTCRICLEVVQPTFHPPNPNLPSIFRSTGYVTYESEEPESGRLIRPCKCKGSSRYVHEACLQQWRYADRDFGQRNYWVCPTCGFRYRVQRVDWARWINNISTQLILTLTVFIVAMFILGFVADPIINLYLDPYDTLTTGDFGRDILDDDETHGWTAHFAKGLASIGVLGFLKVIFVSPWRWWHFRQTGIAGNGRNTGRDRMANLSWFVILIGVATFLYAVYKSVRAWSRRTLEMASEKVLDVPVDGDDEDEGPEHSANK